MCDLGRLCVLDFGFAAKSGGSVRPHIKLTIREWSHNTSCCCTKKGVVNAIKVDMSTSRNDGRAMAGHLSCKSSSKNALRGGPIGWQRGLVVCWLRLIWLAGGWHWRHSFVTAFVT